MGSLVAGAVGLAGSLLGGSSKKSAANTAAQHDLTGFNYLTNPNTGVASVVKNGVNANQAQSDLLSGNNAAQNTAFNNYRNSTGYNFQMDQGTRAITGSAASKGLLNSGATAKALTSFGQGLADSTFNNYFSQLGTLSNNGLTASGQIGSAGNSGGQAAGAAALAGGDAMANGISTGANQIGGAIANNWSKIGSIFG